MKLDRAVDSYLRHVSIERGLSENTVGAYRRDLAGYVEWLAARGLGDSDDVTPAVVAEFVADRASAEPQPAASSIARLQSSVRGLHRFLAREGIEAEDPSSRLRPPKLPQRLPKALTIDQVERLLDASGPSPSDGSASDVIGIRDRALLELLYATGARVSEAVQLDVDDVTHGDVLRVRGKGSKERIVPIGSYARAALDTYLVRSRPELSRRGTATPRLFLGARGAPMSRQSAWLVIQHAADRAHAHGACLAAHAAAFVRDPPPAGRCGRARRAGAARARVGRDDPDLHARLGRRAPRRVRDVASTRALTAGRGIRSRHVAGVDARAGFAYVRQVRAVAELARYNRADNRDGRRYGGVDTARRGEGRSKEGDAPIGPTGRPYHGFADPSEARFARARAHHLAVQSEGRRRQDDDDHQPRGGARGLRPQGARGRLRPAGRALGGPRHPDPRRLDGLRPADRQQARPARVIVPTAVPNLDIIPANIDLSAAEVQLVNEVARETILSRVLRKVTPRTTTSSSSTASRRSAS